MKKLDYVGVPELGAYFKLGEDLTLTSVPMLQDGEMESLDQEVVVDEIEEEEAEKFLYYLRELFGSGKIVFVWDKDSGRLSISEGSGT